MTNSNRYLAFFGALLTLLLGGCGGGGGATTARGQLIDSPVVNIDFRTSGGRTGSTDANGWFDYQAGETVTFHVGDIELGPVPAKERLFLFDFDENAAADNITDTVVRIARFLQSLDSSGGLDDGIQIADEMKQRLQGRQFTFGFDAADAARYAHFGDKLTQELDIANPVSEAMARQHLYAQIQQYLGIANSGATAAIPLRVANPYPVDLKITIPRENEAAYIPPQCYTRTEDTQGGVHNPCYTCHTEGVEPNYVVGDADLQLAYDFAEYATVNHWSNLFEDRSGRVAAISDSDILAFVRKGNYFDANGDIALAQKLNKLPSGWDANGDGQWNGFVPDCRFDFDQRGFDRTADGGYTGWRAFGYYPFPGTFWPTNGSTDDVLIRLAAPFREDDSGDFDREIYEINLAVVEALITRRDVLIEPVDEARYGVDLNKDGTIGQQVAANALVKYDWAPTKGRHMYYVGRAKTLLDNGQLKLAAGLFPVGTEFLHSVRYIDLDGSDRPTLAARMKELRYAVKTDWNTYAQLSSAAAGEAKAKHDFPDRLRTIAGSAEIGLRTGLGWTYQGFIEDRDGDLRPQSYEENMFCIGCHSGIGITTDGIFSFPRKFDHTAMQAGWYHWTQRTGGLAGIPEPLRADGDPEFSFYLMQNHAGDEFRENNEAIAKFFDAQGMPIQSAFSSLQGDIAELLLPSAQRALALNKAYAVIVAEQSFVKGRDANAAPVQNVHRQVNKGTATGVDTPILQQ